jgi:hypothetical protein
MYSLINNVLNLVLVTGWNNQENKRIIIENAPVLPSRNFVSEVFRTNYALDDLLGILD